MKLKKILVFLAISIFAFGNGIFNKLFSGNELTTPTPNLLESQIATVRGEPILQTSTLIGSGILRWTFLTDNNELYGNTNGFVPGISVPQASFASNQTVIGSIDSLVDQALFIVVQETSLDKGNQYVLYTFYFSTKALFRDSILFSYGEVSQITAVGMMNMVDDVPYLIVAGISETNSHNSILAGVIAAQRAFSATFPKITIPNTHFQSFSHFFLNTNTSTTNRQKMYYTSDQYNSATGTWSYGYIGSLVFQLTSDTYSFNLATDNKIYSNDIGSKDLRFAWYYDERLLAWDAEKPSRTFYWVDTATTIGVNFGQSDAPLLMTGNVNYIFNKDGDSQEFMIYGNILGNVSAGFEYDWNSKKVNEIPTQVFLRSYDHIFGGQFQQGSGGTYGLLFNKQTRTTQVYLFNGL